MQMETMLHKKLAVSEKQKEELLGAQHELFQVRSDVNDNINEKN
jgi:hypothetical protein